MHDRFSAPLQMMGGWAAVERRQYRRRSNSPNAFGMLPRTPVWITMKNVKNRSGDFSGSSCVDESAGRATVGQITHIPIYGRQKNVW